MNLDEYRNFCLKFADVTEDLPFDKNTLAFKVRSKIFALLDLETFESVNLKCEPEKAIELRESFAGIKPGYHMNKKHWNTVSTNEDVSDELLRELTTHSYELVSKKAK